MVASTPLRYPSDFPPTTRWKKFFIGVRVLGPDLSFFPILKKLQADRRPEEMSEWGGGLRQEIAEQFGRSLQETLRWPTAVFLRDDSFQVMCHGPKFDLYDDFAVEAAVGEIERQYGFKVPKSFWTGRESATFGEIVDALCLLIPKAAV